MTTTTVKGNTAIVSTNVPAVKLVPANSHPAIPSGMKMTVLKDPEKLDPSSTCPVIECAGITFWPYSYHDNRVSFGIVGYNQNGHLVKQWELKGARYIWEIDIDPNNKIVKFVGQSKSAVQLSWEDLQKPAIVMEDEANYPKDLPFDIKMATLADPEKLDPAKQCPTVLYSGHQFWPCSYIDNRVSFCIVPFHADGNMCDPKELKGARYIWKTELDEANKKVNFIGQSKASVSLSWDEMSWPHVAIVQTNSHPTPPEGSKQATLIEPFTLDSNPDCPVIMYKDYVIWAFSFVDNRESFNIVVYDCQGNIIKQIEKTGARYVWQITSDSEKRTIAVWGQSNKKVEVTWDEIDI